MSGSEPSALDRATLKATTLWAVAIIRTDRKESWRDAGDESVLNIAISENVDEIAWFLNEDQADRRIAELRKAGKKYAAKIRKLEIAFGQRLEAGQAHQLCEAMSVAWAERALMTRSGS